MERILVFGASGDKLGGINAFLINMNEHMSGECVFDYVIEGPNSINAAEIAAAGGREYHTCYFMPHVLRNILQLRAILRECRSDHSVAYFNLFSMVHIPEILQAKLHGYRIILHAHNNEVESKGALYRFLHRFNRFLLDGMRCTRLTNSQLSSDFMFGRRGRRQAELIRNAVDTDKYRFDEAVRSQKRAELGIDDKIVIGFSGRLQDQKNPLFLIDVFKEIHARNSNTVLLVAGEGHLRGAVEQRIAENDLADCVMLLGNRRDMPQLYQAMDLFLLPSLFEGLGIVLIEAQCSGLPCVASADVIPRDAKVTDLLTFTSLKKSPAEWADVCLAKLDPAHSRCGYDQVVRDAGFDIRYEAKRLEGILCREG